MTLYRKVQAVERLFKQLEKEVAALQQATKLKCVAGCGQCCKTPNIVASPVEFLPLAYQLYKQGLALEWYQKLGNRDSPLCNAFQEFSIAGAGRCSQYEHRGLICRLFGFSAINKNGKYQLVSCKILKAESAFADVIDYLNQKKNVPTISHYYLQLQNIDYQLGSLRLPINEAIREALKVVLSYYAYRKPRAA